MADEIRRINQLIESKLEGNGKLAVVYPYPAFAWRFVLYREIFGDGNGPKPLTQEEASESITLGNTITNRETARTKSLEILNLLITSMTQGPDNDGQIDQSNAEARLIAWLAATTPASDGAFAHNNAAGSISDSFRFISTPTPTGRSAMDAVSEADGVSLEQYASAIYAYQAGPSSSDDRGDRVADLTTRMNHTSLDSKLDNRMNDGGKDSSRFRTLREIEREEDQPTYTQRPLLPSQMPNNQHLSPTLQQSNTQRPHAFQLSRNDALQPQTRQQTPFNTMSTPGPTTPQGTAATAAAPNLAQFQSQPTASVPNAPYQQLGPWYQGQPPYQHPGMVSPMYAMQNQQFIPYPHPFMLGGYGPVYGPAMPHYAFPMPQYGFASGYSPTSTSVPALGPQPSPAPQFFQGRPLGGALGSPPTPVRSTLPPADRLSTQSIWAKPPKEFNIAEWAQQNRPQTPNTSFSAVVQSQSVADYPKITGGTEPNVRYRVGQNTMYPRMAGTVSLQLRELTRDGIPTFTKATASDLFPFEGIGRLGTPSLWGVVRISNIPYGLTCQEVVAFLGRHAKILTPDLGCAVHITMDRLTGKTMDCFVEFLSSADAQVFVNSKNSSGQPLKLADRAPSVQMSTQDQLLAHIFPKANNTTWENGMPTIIASSDPYNTGYKGFVTAEEMVKLVQHAEYPQRSNYTVKCLQRVYECMISTLTKFPWYAANAYTIGTRNQIYAATSDLLRILLLNVKRGTHPYLNSGLLEELLYAGLNAAGFSEKQRWDLCRVAELTGRAVRISPLSKDWPFEVLGRKVDIPEDLIAWYVDRLTRHLDRPGLRPTLNPFRTFLLPPNRGDEATMDEQGELEVKCLLDIYKHVLPA